MRYTKLDHGFWPHVVAAGVCILILAGNISGQEHAPVETPGEVDEQRSSEPVFAEDFENGLAAWEILDPKTWRLKKADGNTTLEITARKSEYKPPVRSPWHVALVKGVEIGDFDLTFRVRSTKDTGDHRDCCVFFGYQDDQHFYYVHLGAKPDPHSGQIMTVKEAPRLALTKNEKPTPWDDKWHTVKLERRLGDGTINVYFDDMDTPHMSVKDTTFGVGRIGIGSFDDLNEFDDIKLMKK